MVTTSTAIGSKADSVKEAAEGAIGLKPVICIVDGNVLGPAVVGMMVVQGIVASFFEVASVRNIGELDGHVLNACLCQTGPHLERDNRAASASEKLWCASSDGRPNKLLSHKLWDECHTARRQKCAITQQAGMSAVQSTKTKLTRCS